MLKEERFNHILKVIKKRGKVIYETLSEDLNISEDTVRRDIESLHNNGLLLKVRGGAISISKNPLSFQDRTRYLAEKKKKLIALKGATADQRRAKRFLWMEVLPFVQLPLISLPTPVSGWLRIIWH